MDVMDYTEVMRRFEKSLTAPLINYLHSRGLTDETIAHFHLGGYNQKNITIPRISAQKCRAIKYRTLPQYVKPGTDAYKSLPGHSTLGLFNADVLADIAYKDYVLVVANSQFDVMLLHQLGFKCIGPYAGESSWDVLWLGNAKPEIVVNIGDYDEEVLRNGIPFRPGTEYMLHRAAKLAEWHSIEKVINVFPPDNFTDINAAYMGGVNIQQWLQGVINEEEGTN